VLLMRLTFSLAGLGRTELTLSDSQPFDLTEGFALNPPPVGQFATVHYANDPTNFIEVVPEPAAGVSLLLAGVALRRRG
jgi:hypothetical protein